MRTEEDIRKIFCENLNRLIKERKVTQRDIADYVKVSYPTVNHWVKGNKVPRMDKIDKLCDYFLCKRSDLLESKDNVVPDNDTLVLLTAARRRLKEKYKGNTNSEEYLSELRAANYYMQEIAGKNSDEIPPIRVTEKEEQLLIIRYRTLDEKSQAKIRDRVDELCTLYSMGVDMDKVDSIKDLFEKTQER